MQGCAQKLFYTKKLKGNLQDSKFFSCMPDNRILEFFFNRGILSYADLFLAKNLLGLEGIAIKGLVPLVCHLSLAIRQGHLCIEYTNDTVRPDPSLLWKLYGEEEEAGDLQEELNEITDLILLGIKNIPLEYLCDPDLDLTQKPFVIKKNILYLQKFWSYEKKFIESIITIDKAVPLFNPDAGIVRKEVDRLFKEGKILPEQSEAIPAACHNNLTLITGGPGTGKTYTAGIIIKIFIMSITEEEKKNCSIILAAPTGKAAFNLQNSLNYLPEDSSFSIKTKTLHSLLEGDSNRNKGGSGYIEGNFIVIDESSMIDAKMMSRLLSSVRPGTKMIFLGDKYQLPAVESGCPFSDLLKIRERDAPLSVIELKKCLRADIREIVTFAESVNKGDIKAILEVLNTNDAEKTISGFFYDANSRSGILQQIILKEALSFFCSIIQKKGQSYDSLIEEFNSFRILSPLRKGTMGVESVNKLIFDQLVKERVYENEAVIPIIITKNDYSLQLFNGETGLLVKKNGNFSAIEKGDFALFPTREVGDDKEKYRKIPALLLKHYEYAFCISIHKSQGSEFKEIMILFPKNAARFGREVFYTAVTRAKRKIRIITDKITITKIIENRTERISGLG